MRFIFNATFIADIFADRRTDGRRCLKWPAKQISRNRPAFFVDFTLLTIG
jgi:hypothetical protein